MTSSPDLISITATRWRVLATTNPLAVALVAGVLATHIATITGYWYHGIGLPDLDWPRFNGYLLFRAELGDDAALVLGVPSALRLVLGWIVHLFTGVVFAMVYAMLIQPMLRWNNNLWKVLLWGGILATISAMWWAPVLFPEFQLGFFTWNLAGWKGVAGIYLWHLIWAVNLYLFYNPLNDDELTRLRLP